MADTLITDTKITREALRVLHSKLNFVRHINREHDDSFAKSGGKIGSTLKIRQPVEFTVRTGNTLSLQDITENTRTLTVATIKGVDWDFVDDDLTLTIDDFSARYLQPAMARLAAEIDYDAQTMYQEVNNQVGTAGTTPASALVYLQAGQKLDEFLTPRDGNRHMLINPAAQATTVDALKGLFQNDGKLSKQYDEGLMGEALGFKFWMNQNTRRHTVGPLGGTPLVNGASQGITSGWAATTSLITDGWTAAAASRLKDGDIFTIANVNAVNPETKASTGSLMQFVVTADVSSDGSGNLTAVVSPAIISAGSYQNVDAAPADNAALTVVGTASTAYPMNLAFHKDAFTLVTADLEVPKGTDMASRQKYDGISLRFVRDYDVTNNKRICRFDILYGYLAQRPQLGCRVIG